MQKLAKAQSKSPHWCDITSLTPFSLHKWTSAQLRERFSPRRGLIVKPSLHMTQAFAGCATAWGSPGVSSRAFRPAGTELLDSQASLNIGLSEELARSQAAQGAGLENPCLCASLTRGLIRLQLPASTEYQVCRVTSKLQHF